MRWRRLPLLALAGSLAAHLPARADVDVGPAKVSGSLEAGGRGVTGDTDSAKFNEYNDPHEGAFGALDLSARDTSDRWYLRFGGFDLGEEDADYFLEGGRWGLWGLYGSYSLLPHNYSDQALSPYLGIDGGNLSLPFAPPADAAGFEAGVTGASRDAELGFDTNEGKVGAFFKPTANTELRAGYRMIDRDGRRPEQITYGFSNFVHFPRPVDETIHEGTADVLFARDSWSVALNYTASFFENDFRSIQVANPATFAGGSPLGAIAAEPDNSSHLLSLTSSALLPTSFPTRIAGTVAYGMRTQDQAFVPLTVNPALAPAPLPAHDLDGDVRPLLANFVLTSRPTPKLEVTGRYRLYDYDNNSDEILFTQTSTTDASLAAETVRSTAPSYTTQNASLETSYRLTERVKATVGVAWLHWKRGPEREVRESDEWSPGARLDYRAGSWGRFRAGYEFHDQNAHGYDELAPFRELRPFDPPTPLTPPIRKFDEAGNLRHTFHFLSQLFPLENLDVGFSGNMHLTEWKEGDFGLISDDSFDVGLDATFRPHPRIEISAFYTYDWGQLLQRSASSGGTLVWRSQSQDTGSTAGLDVALAVLPERLTLTAGFLAHAGNGRTQADGAPADAVDYPEIEDTLWAASTSLEYRWDEHLSLIARYRYEHYDQSDFQFDGLGVTRLTSNVEGQPLLGTNNDVFLHNGLEDYAVNLFSLSVVYHF